MNSQPRTNEDMAIVVNLDVMMAKRKMSVTELANKVDITMANLSILKIIRRRSRAFYNAGCHMQGA